jgi:hypothetical protein
MRVNLLVPFSLLKVSNGCGAFHVMSTTLCCCDTGSGCALSPPHTRQFDGVVVVTRAFILGDLLIVLLEEALELCGSDDVRLAVI